jgi:phenylacetate-CoA ligase
METLTGETLERVRWTKLQRQIRYVYDNSRYYRDKFKSIGAAPDDIKSLDDFYALPVMMGKDEQRASQEESLKVEGHPYGTYATAPINKIVGAYTTSGTTGMPTFYLFTMRDFEVHNELTARIFWRAGLRPGDALLWAFGTGVWVAGAIPPCFRHMGVRSINVGTEGGSEALIRNTLLMRPQTLVATPTMLEYLIERTPKLTGKPVSALGYKRLVSGGEPGAGLPATRKKIEAAFKADLYDFIGPTSQFGYISCRSGEFHGMHNAAPDMHLWGEDLVDPITKKHIPLTDGAIGEAYMTDLEREAGPVMKYAYGDIVQVFTKPCTCGLPGTRLKILGRADDMLIIKGVNVYPAAIKSLVDGFVPRASGAIRIVLTQRPPRVEPPLRIEVEPDASLGPNDLETLRQELDHAMHVQLRFRPSIVFVEPGSISRAPIKTKLLDHRY